MEPEDKLLQATLLLDTYGSLLTERQRTFARLHFEEDLSFSGIAREFGITRQAVHDSVRHALHTLEGFEKALGLVTKAREAGAQARIGGRQLIERLEWIRERVRTAEPGTSCAWVAGELDELIDLLRGGEKNSGPAPEGPDSPEERTP